MRPRSLYRFASILSLLGCTATLLAQSPADTSAFPWEGEVTATNVYVRSGAGSNWYPTTKLNKGDRVLVLGEKFGWYQITPPAGSFSFVDLAVVDRPPGSTRGTIKQDKVYVRAGSRLEQRKNSTQVVLNKGDTVEIIGEADGFLKINPPPGATLYMSKQYIRPVEARLRTGLVEKYVSGQPIPQPGPAPAATAEPAPVTPAPATPASVAQSDATPMPPPENAIKIPEAAPLQTPDSSSGVVSNAERMPAAEPPVEGNVAADALNDELAALSKSVDANRPRKADLPAGSDAPQSVRYKTMLTVLESELVSVLARPLEQQDLEGLAKKYEEIANQSDEYVPAQIAKIRIRQLRDRAQLRLARSEIRSDSDSIAAYRAGMEQERMKIMRRRVEAAMVKYDLEGELWRSYAFAPDSRRYRLVDPATKNTIAYVDIPVETDPNPEYLIGRLIGITCAGQKFSPSARVPIAVASSITDLSPRNRTPVQFRQSDPPPAIETEPDDLDDLPAMPAQIPDERPESELPANSDEIPEPPLRP